MRFGAAGVLRLDHRGQLLFGRLADRELTPARDRVCSGTGGGVQRGNHRRLYAGISLDEPKTRCDYPVEEIRQFCDFLVQLSGQLKCGTNSDSMSSGPCQIRSSSGQKIRERLSWTSEGFPTSRDGPLLVMPWFVAAI